MTVTADEINILIRRYLQETGFFHTAYVFAHECLLEKSALQVPQLPPQALVTILKKGMLYMQMEKGINEKAKTDDSPQSIIVSLIETVRSGEPIVPVRRHRPKPPPPPVKPQPRPVPVLLPIQPISLGTDDALILRGHFSDVYCGAWTPDGRCLATGSGDATATIWELRNDEYVQHYILDHATQQERTGNDIATLAWNPTGTVLATGCYDGTARLWTIRGELKFVLVFHSDSVFTVQFSPDGTTLLTGSPDQ
jgi:transducin (beta)-like 1